MPIIKDVDNLKCLVLDLMEINFRLFDMFEVYLREQFSYALPVEYIDSEYRYYFVNERDAKRAQQIYDVFLDNKPLKPGYSKRISTKELEECIDWCYNNIQNVWIVVNASQFYVTTYSINQKALFYFDNDEDLMLFILKWG
jgi:hypothetical protein